LEIDGVQASGFSEVSGLDITTEVIEYREGSEPTHVRKMPGLTKYGNVTLKWGITDSTELHDWHRQIVDGTIERKSVVVVIIDEEGQDKGPCRYQVNDLDGKGTDIAIEMIELCNEGIVRVA
jgi:phage tail-like protein